MASVHRIPGKPNWVCFFTDRNGKRRCRSTLTTNKKEAASICAKIQSIEEQARTGRITAEKARRVIEGVVDEIMAESGTPIVRKLTREHFEAWLSALESECSDGTFVRYKGIVKTFL